MSRIGALLTFRTVYAYGESVLESSSRHIFRGSFEGASCPKAAQHDITEGIAFRLADLVKLVCSSSTEKRERVTLA